MKIHTLLCMHDVCVCEKIQSVNVCVQERVRCITMPVKKRIRLKKRLFITETNLRGKSKCGAFFLLRKAACWTKSRYWKIWLLFSERGRLIKKSIPNFSDIFHPLLCLSAYFFIFNYIPLKGCHFLYFKENCDFGQRVVVLAPTTSFKMSRRPFNILPDT